MELIKLKSQYSGRKFGELVLSHMKGQTHNYIIKALQGTIDLVSESFNKNEIMRLIDEFNEEINEKSFWANDSGNSLSFITNKTKKRFMELGLTASDEDLFNVYNIIVLNFTYSANVNSDMKKYIKSSIRTGFFTKPYAKKIYH